MFGNQHHVIFKEFLRHFRRNQRVIGINNGLHPACVQVLDNIKKIFVAVGIFSFIQQRLAFTDKRCGGYAESIGLRDAVSFGPALIVNGEAANYSGVGGGLNPRTAIGQRADGAVLLLAIEGRRSSSMGATMADLIDIMVEYGAVNAFNLDGGMSSSLWYNGEEIIDNANIRQDRAIPTAWVVLPQGVSASDAAASAEVTNEEA